LIIDAKLLLGVRESAECFKIDLNVGSAIHIGWDDRVRSWWTL